MAGAIAYAAVVSVRRVLENILHHAPQRILVDKQQIQSLLEKITSFQQFLEDYDALPMTSKPQVEDGLESQMAKACYAAEDIIESFVLDQIQAPSQKVMKIKGKMEVVKDQQPVNFSHADGLSRRLAPNANDTVTGLDSHLLQLKERLVGDEPNLQMVSIVGMGGIGKTTLARTIFDDPLIVQNFEIRAWVTISQEYDMRETLLALLHVTEILFGKRKQEDSANNVAKLVDIMSKHSDEQGKGKQEDSASKFVKFVEAMSKHSDEQLGEQLRKICMEGGEACPLELVEIGKQIAQSCKGLPLALVVIGGLLAKSQRTIEQWKDVAENLASIINLGNHEQCLKILALSYRHLPIHLKPCFLYMATFPEDCEIRISRLIKLWIAEGFVNPVVPNSLEDIAMEYLKELIDRNLLIVRQQGTLGKMKSCIIHDLLRDLCLREAQKENFLCITKVYDVDFPPNIQNTRRLGIHRSTKQFRYNPRVLNTLRSASSTRSVVCESEWISPWLAPCLKLLRVLNVHDKYSPEEIMQLINSRFLYFAGDWDLNSRLTSSVSLLWNLQSLIVHGSCSTILPSEIWEMTQLRHLKFENIVLPDPPRHSHLVDSQDSYILENLCTLTTVENFKLTEEVVKRIPNIKKIKIAYRNDFKGSKLSSYCLENLARLSKLESLALDIKWSKENCVGNFALPHSLKKLSLRGCYLPWEDMRIVGSLPKLEILRLNKKAFVGEVWNPSEGEFGRLKFLQISSTNLEYWGAENTHFPSLEHLVLSSVGLEELPLGLAEIHTLRFIHLNYCSKSAVDSVEKIREERESLGYEDVQIEISRIWRWLV
ncbi:putative late blight resistance proteinR1A-4 [Sesamum alatum]|uniref:Late blight resistance proteinR1A-4 n=1 Tax=Sesamum alatum TaxID=300844 RepID=A0AAE1YVU5_9LAMI|nr:putative late blight resistance proteinR1A-4 [Sesamum alatum]